MGNSNTTVVMQFFDGINKLDVDTAVDVFADNGTFTAIGAQPLGKDGLRKLLQGLLDAFEPGLRVQVHAIVEKDDIVMVRGEGDIRLKAGGTYNNTYMWFIRLKDGKAVEWEEFCDGAVVENSFGSPISGLVAAVQ